MLYAFFFIFLLLFSQKGQLSGSEHSSKVWGVDNLYQGKEVRDCSKEEGLIRLSLEHSRNWLM